MDKKWEIQHKGNKSITSITGITGILLANRGIKTEKQKDLFFNPIHPDKLNLELLGISKLNIEKAIKRLNIAKKNNEHIIVYGDYDADGICSTAILWEALYKDGYKAMPHIPDRFSEGYGIKADSVKKLKTKDEKLKLIITVDNGIVAYDGVKKANELGIDVIVIDHHQKGNIRLKAYSIIHSTLVCGSVLSYLFAVSQGRTLLSGLELVALGTIADQIPLIGINRSFVKYGLEAINKTKRLGLRAIMRESRLEKVGPYEVGFIIAPRLNAAGRLTHAIDSLRLLCTRNFYKANELSQLLRKINQQRQKIVEEVLKTAETIAGNTKDRIIMLSDKSYHEGVIGLAAGRIAEKFNKPSIVLSENGEIAKASARSVPGFNIIAAIKKLNNLIIEGGGHPMAAGFSININNIDKFRKEINKFADKQLKIKDLKPAIKVDLEVGFNQLNQELMETINLFEPFGLGNPVPLFVTRKVKVIEVKKVGAEGKHLKLKLQQNDITFDAIAFGLARVYQLKFNDYVDVVYSLDENHFNDSTTLQLKVKDLKHL